MENEIVRHVLVGRFRAGTSETLIQSFFTNFRDMVGKIEGVVAFEYGVNNSTEGMNRGLTHVVTLTFASVAARDAYLPHAEHRKFVAWIGLVNILEELLVVDYIPQNGD
jgi:hypothetical protein